MSTLTGPRASRRGQTLAELGIIMPILLMLFIGILEFGWVLYQEHVAIKIAREGANLISRSVPLGDVETVVRSAQPYPGPFDPNVRVVLSVLRLGSSGSNNNRAVITHRRVAGSLSGQSALGDPPANSYGNAPNYAAKNPDSDTSIRATLPLPNGLTLTAGQAVYVAEIFTRRKDIASMVPIGVILPSPLYAAAYF